MKNLDLVLGFDGKFMTGFFDMERTENIYFTGCSRDINYFKYITTHAYFMDRTFAEKELEFKQFVPYLVLNYGDLYAIHSVEKSTSRNYGKISIGISCHVTDLDKMPGNRDMYSYITNAVYRRFSNEFSIKDSVPFDDLMMKANFRHPTCFIYSDFAADGSFDASNHLGIVYLIKVSEDIKRRIDFSSDSKTLEWFCREDLLKSPDSLTDWSKLYLESL